VSLHRTMGLPLLGLLRSGGAEELELVLYAQGPRRRVAVVRGSPSYILLALTAVGLASPPITPRGLREQGYRSGLSLVGYQPSHRHPKRAR
jgi:hypothetical protein